MLVALGKVYEAGNMIVIGRARLAVIAKAMRATERKMVRSLEAIPTMAGKYQLNFKWVLSCSNTINS